MVLVYLSIVYLRAIAMSLSIHLIAAWFPNCIVFGSASVQLDLGWGELLQRLQRVARGGGIKGMAVNLVRLLDPAAADVAQKERKEEKAAKLQERKRKREAEEGEGGEKQKKGEEEEEEEEAATSEGKSQSAIDRKRKKLAKAKKAKFQAAAGDGVVVSKAHSGTKKQKKSA